MRVDAAEVARAARRLEAEGRAVSTRAVREITGGNLRDVAPLVKRWRADRAREAEARRGLGQGAGDDPPRTRHTAGDAMEREPKASGREPLAGPRAEIEARMAAHVEAATEAAQAAAAEMGRLRETVAELAAALRGLQEELARLREGAGDVPRQRR